MGNVLYEVHYQFNFAYLIPILLIIFISIYSNTWNKSVIHSPNIQRRGTTVNVNFIRIFCLFVIIFSISVSVITIFYEFNEYKNIIIGYKNGDYLTTEGYIENFKPMPYSGHSDETFYINDVYFSYSDYEGNIGYINTKSHGGVIQGNGQHLKIKYIYFNGKNRIAYIEDLDTYKVD